MFNSSRKIALIKIVSGLNRDIKLVRSKHTQICLTLWIRPAQSINMNRVWAKLRYFALLLKTRCKKTYISFDHGFKGKRKWVISLYHLLIKQCSVM
jgi:hypothetical protein